MSSLDDIKRKLSIDEMDNDSRKKMFNKFVEKGGEVIKEKPKVNRGSSRSRGKSIELADENETGEEQSKEQNKKGAGHRQQGGAKKRAKKRYSFFMFIRGIFYGTFSLSKRLNHKLAKNIQDDLTQIFSSLNFACGQFISTDMEKKIRIVDFLNESYPYSYELIMRFYDLYKISNLSKIQNYTRQQGSIELSPNMLETFIVLYKDLVILYPYWETSKEQLWKALLYYESVTNIHPAISRSKLNRYIDKLFEYYLPHLHSLITYNYNEQIIFSPETIKEFIGITAEEDVGSLTDAYSQEKKRFLEEQEKEKKERKEKLKESVEKKEMEKIPKFIQKGLTLIDSIIENIPEKVKKDKEAKLFEPNEKMLYFYFLFNEFDKEYSFLLTTSQMKLISRLESGVRTDIRSEFDEEFIKFNEISNFIREYVNLMQEYHNVKLDLEDSPLLAQQKLSNLTTKRARTFNEIKVRATLFFKKFAITLQKLINDYRGEKLLLQNPDDVLKFTLSRNKKNKFDNIPIIKAIAAAYSFTSALHYYIAYDELSQKSIYLEKKGPRQGNEKSNNE